METQHRITRPTELLDEEGYLIEPGYATQLLWQYDRNKIRAGWHRIKEWDYYYILNEKHGITFTMSDLGYAGLMAVVWLDFEKGTCTQEETLSLLPRGRMNFPSTSEEGDVAYQDKKLKLGYYVERGMRTIGVEAPQFANKRGEQGLSGEIVLHQDPGMDTMVIATSWKQNRRKFYYNQKINCMPAEGTIRIGETEYVFTPEDSFGGLDWGRGNWTYKNRWYWGSASGLLNGEPFGWNIGYGFSDRSAASENMVFYKGMAHKLDQVTFHMDVNDYTRPWKFTSNDGRFEMDFEPLIDRYGKFNLLLIKSEQHQVFGHFTGKAVLDDGTELSVDRFLGFAEDVYNRW
ncbi:MAG: DUF2804 domain-containing protein [Candidatus Thorarchaeota archaeon]|nr:DUF2804 domain-containing protein [Candidatus Thorarchaeota archaeon]